MTPSPASPGIPEAGLVDMVVRVADGYGLSVGWTFEFLGKCLWQ